MKKSLAILLVLMLMISSVFFGCGKKPDADSDGTEESTTENQSAAVENLEQELSKQPLVVLTAQYLKKGDEGNSLDSDAVYAYTMNSSEKTVTYAVLAFAAWDADDNPVLLKSESDDKGEYVKRVSYFGLSVPKGNIFGDRNALAIAEELSGKIEVVKAIPVSCTYEDGTNWVNPCYEDFCSAYEGKTFVEPENSTDETVTTEKPIQDNTTTSAVSGDENITTSKNDEGQSSGDGNNSNQNTDNNNTSEQQNYNVYKCKEIFESGAYKMSVVTDKGTADEAQFTMAVKNGNIYMTTVMDGMAATMLYQASKDTTYMMFDSLKMYCDVTEEMMGDDMDMSELTKDFTISIPGKITVSQVVFEGTKATCESFVDANGTQCNYYFDESGNLIGREDFEKGGTVSRMTISDFTGQVPDSQFEIPKGYNYVNLSWLMALMG